MQENVENTITLLEIFFYPNSPIVEIGRYAAAEKSVHDRFIGYECKPNGEHGCLHIHLNKAPKLKNEGLIAAQLGTHVIYASLIIARTYKIPNFPIANIKPNAIV